jgi:Ca2+-binding RTX toxin-like protein
MRSFLAGVFAIGVLASMMPAALAQVIPGDCTFDSDTAVLVFGSDDPITVVRNGDALWLNGAGCEGASVTNTDLMRLFSDSITIDLAGGSLAPGATDEGDGSSEIELEIETHDLDVLGTSFPDHLVVGRASRDCPSVGILDWSAVNLNADETTPDADIFDCSSTFEGTGFSSLVGRGGNDILSLAGEGLSDSELSGHLTMLGGLGDDTLISGTGDDTIRGQQGVDTFDASEASSEIWILVGPLSETDTAVGGSIGDDEIAGFERYVTSFADDFFDGSDRDETFIGGGGVDDIWPRGGDDIIVGGPGPDFLYYRDAPRGIHMDLREGVASGDGNDVVTGIEVVEGTRFDDEMLGNGINNIFSLGRGDDVARGRRGADSISGDGGNDSLDGGLGADYLYGGSGQADRCRTDPSDTVFNCELHW